MWETLTIVGLACGPFTLKCLLAVMNSTGMDDDVLLKCVRKPMTGKNKNFSVPKENRVEIKIFNYYTICIIPSSFVLPYGILMDCSLSSRVGRQCSERAADQ